MKTFYPVPLHIHSVWERHASMEGHFYNAQKLGIHHMYITDHDVRMGRKKAHIDSFDFSHGKVFIHEDSPDPLRPRHHGFKKVSACDGAVFGMTESNEMILSARSDGSTEWSVLSVEFDSSQKRQDYALLARVLLHLGMKVSKMDEDTRVIIDVRLSQRPPLFHHGHILYVFGNDEGLEDCYKAVKKVWAESGCFNYSFDLLKDAENVGGGDNVMNTITITAAARNGKNASLLMNSFKITWDLAFEEARKEQQKLADELGSKYGVKPIVTTEISAAGHHKISFSTKVPIIDYEKLGYSVTDDYARQQVKKYGGIFSWNHPFEEYKDKVHGGIIDEQHKEIMDAVIKEYTENRVFGASMIEVGYPESREGFTLHDHLALWDALSENGIFIGGYGDSDNHTNDTLWFDGNNFVAFLGADNPCEDEFIKAMKRGELYTGDPAKFRGEVCFTDDSGHRMGQAIRSTSESYKILLRLTHVPEDCTVRFIVDGSTVKEEKAAGTYSGDVILTCNKKVNFARAELYMGNRCIMLTNPIYYVSDDNIPIPDERLAT